MGEKEKKAGKEKKQTGKTMNPPEESDISPEEAAGTAAGIMAGAMAGPAAKVMVKAAATGAMKKTPAKAKKTAPKKAEKKAGREQTEKKKAQEAAAEAISKVLGALPIINIAATTPAFNDMLETVLRNMGEGLKTGASVTTELDKLWMEHLEITDRSEDGYDFWTNLAVLSMKSRTEELLSNSKIVLGAGKKLADVGAETIDIARDLYKIGAACKAYLEGKYDHFLDDLWKGLEEACEELGMVFSHPKEALEAKLKEQKEAIANSTPEDHGYLAMGIVLDFLGPAAIKKAGRVVKLAAKHIKAPGSFDLTKPTNGSIVEDAFSNMVSEALDGDGQEDEETENTIFKEINIHGDIDTELDEVDLKNKIIYEDKSAINLYMENPDVPQTEKQWANKQILKKGSKRIDAILQENYRLSSSVSSKLPKIEDLKSIKNYVFRIDADTPALRNAVQEALEKLKIKYPDYNFYAIYGGEK